MATSWTGWSREQEEVLARAERLRAFGAHQAAQDVIALEVPWPARMSMQRVLETGQQDVRRWYRAYTGVEWDGRLQSVQNARENARRRRPAGARTEPWREGPHQGYGAFRTSHLLVDPLDSHPRLSEVRDYTRRIGWPAGSHVGTLAWDEPAALHCVFCDAVLLPSEAIDIDGTAGCVAGKMCCMSGYTHLHYHVISIRYAVRYVSIVRVLSGRKVNPPVMPEWPLWLRRLWLGWPGQAHGEEGLIRSAARRYSRQIHNGLSMASQVR